jgi:hypothetical protein
MPDREAQSSKKCLFFTVYGCCFMMFWCSFSIIGPLEAGLMYSSLTLTYDFETVYKNGRHIAPFWKRIDQYPTTWQPLMFCKDCPAKDLNPVSNKAAGQDSSPVNIELEVFLYYRVKLAKVWQLMKNFPQRDHKKKFKNVATKAIKDVIAMHTVKQLLQEREIIAHIIATRVNEELSKEGSFVAACYLGTVGLAPTSDTAFLRQWISIRQQKTSEEQGKVLKVIQSTAAAVSSEERKRVVILSDQYRLGNTTIEEYRARGEEMVLTAQGKAYRALQERLNFTQTQLLKYIYYEKLRSTSANLVAGFSENEKLLSTGS